MQFSATLRGRDEKRAPPKTPAWEANKFRAPKDLVFLDQSDKSPDSGPGLDNGQTTRKVNDYLASFSPALPNKKGKKDRLIASF